MGPRSTNNHPHIRLDAITQVKGSPRIRSARSRHRPLRTMRDNIMTVAEPGLWRRAAWAFDPTLVQTGQFNLCQRSGDAKSGWRFERVVPQAARRLLAFDRSAGSPVRSGTSTIAACWHAASPADALPHELFTSRIGALPETNPDQAKRELSHVAKKRLLPVGTGARSGAQIAPLIVQRLPEATSYGARLKCPTL